MDGNYSIQVLIEAIQSVDKNYTCQPITAPEVKNTITDMTLEQGFIAHNGDHWIAIRKIKNVWYNLNSTNMTPPGPQFISDF